MEDDRIEDPKPQPPIRNPAHKVIAIAAGEAHTLALSEEGRVYSWGRGAFGRLGNGLESDEHFPVQIKLENDNDLQNEKPLKFVGVAAGAYHSLALDDDGSVWGWGYNSYSQLGFDGENVSIPRKLELVQLDSPQSLGDDSERKSETQLRVCAIKAGGMMSLAIDNLGVLWMWGNIPQQSSPDDDTFTLASFPTPIPMPDFYGHTVVKVACGNEHVVALVSAGEKHTNDDDLVCYAWGNNNHGQLGLGDTESRSRPQLVTQFSEVSVWRAYEVACGAFHTVVLTLKKRPSDTLESVCWTFGLGENGQLGHGTTQNASLPESVSGLPEHAYFVAVDCGLFHTSVVSTTGEVWSWGMEKGLGLCPDVSFSGIDHGDAILPLQISCNGSQGPNFLDSILIACGAAHTILVADDGYKLWSWGRGRNGVLGDGKGSDSYSPTRVLWPPLSEDFSDGLNSTDAESKKPEESEHTETEMKLLQLKYLVMERYASILHGSLFGRPFEERDIPASLLESDSFDFAKVWQSMLEAADGKELRRLEMFYGNMIDGVKDKIMKRKIKEIVREFMQSSSTTQQ